MNKLKKLTDALNIAKLWMTNSSGYIAEKAKREDWKEITLTMEPFFTLYNNQLAGYSVCAQNSAFEERKYELMVQ